MDVADFVRIAQRMTAIFPSKCRTDFLSAVVREREPQGISENFWRAPDSRSSYRMSATIQINCTDLRSPRGLCDTFRVLDV